MAASTLSVGKEYLVIKRRLGKTGLEVSPLGFGGGPIGFLETQQRQVSQILHTLLDLGVNVIDTAAGYLGSEEAIGRAVADRRNEYVLVSKCGDASAPDGPSWSAPAITQSIEQSLRRLQTDHVDVMLLHSADLATLERGEAVEALCRARDAGKVRFAGYSGDNEAAVYAARLPDIAVIETSINLCDQANIEHVLPETLQHDVGVIAKRPLANAAWKDLSQQPGLYGSYAAVYTQRLARMAIDLADFGIDGHAPDAWPSLALRFVLSQPGVHTAIIGTTHPEHARANVAAAAKGPLPDATVARLRTAFRQAERASGEIWEGQV